MIKIRNLLKEKSKFKLLYIYKCECEHNKVTQYCH